MIFGFLGLQELAKTVVSAPHIWIQWLLRPVSNPDDLKEMGLDHSSSQGQSKTKPARSRAGLSVRDTSDSACPTPRTLRGTPRLRAGTTVAVPRVRVTRYDRGW